jgi:hypothetical protein
MIPREVRFHSDPHDGVAAFLHGALSGEELNEKLGSFWWKRPTPWNPDQSWGLYRTIAQEDFEAGRQAFTALHTSDPLEASRALVRAMLDPLAARAGKPAWIEHTPGNNGISAPMLHAVFPRAKFVHVVRDGRDRACSVTALPWGPDSIDEAISLWETRLRAIDRLLQSLPADRHTAVQLEDLVLEDREGSYRRILDFLELDDEPAMRSFFDSEVTPARAHVGRRQWEVPEAEREHVEAAYRDALERLRSDGVSCVPPERELAASYRAHPSEQPSGLDPWSDRTGTNA